MVLKILKTKKTSSLEEVFCTQSGSEASELNPLLYYNLLSTYNSIFESATTFSKKILDFILFKKRSRKYTFSLVSHSKLNLKSQEIPLAVNDLSYNPELCSLSL
jgi:hypothetical protein